MDPKDFLLINHELRFPELRCKSDVAPDSGIGLRGSVILLLLESYVRGTGFEHPESRVR